LTHDDALHTQAVLSSLAVTTNNPALHKILFCRQEASKDAVEDASAQSKHAQTSLLDILIDIWHEAEGRLGVVADATDKLAWIRASLGASDSVTVRITVLAFDVATSQCFSPQHSARQVSRCLREEIWLINSRQVQENSGF